MGLSAVFGMFTMEGAAVIFEQTSVQYFHHILFILSSEKKFHIYIHNTYIMYTHILYWNTIDNEKYAGREEVGQRVYILQYTSYDDTICARTTCRE